MKNSIAIMGIHTGIGKTIASAVIAEAIGADYWKPVQAGIEERDMLLVEQLITDGINRVHKEAVLLSQPMSPHAAAVIDNVEIDFTKFVWPETKKNLVVETAGGVLSPVSSKCTAADFVGYYQLPVILIVQNYLGSINHTLLSIEVLKSRGIQLLGIIMNGNENLDSESFITDYGRVPILAKIPQLTIIDKQSVALYANKIKLSLLETISRIE